MKTRFCLERLLCVGVSSCLLTMLLHRITHGNLALTSVIFILPVYLLLYRCGTGSFARVFLGRAPPEPGARGRTILKEIAASAGYGAIVAALVLGTLGLRDHFFYRVEEVQNTELDEAISQGDASQARRLIEGYPALAMERLPYGVTFLHLAAQKDRREIVVLLLAHKARVNARSTRGFTPLLVASLKGHCEVAKLLLASGAEVDARGPSGKTSLYYAAAQGDRPLAELLLFEHADVNAQADSGATPLRGATENGRQEVAALLRQHGARE